MKNLDQTGQHYMVDKKLIKFIVDAGALSEDDVVLEIGYGHGELTRRIAKKCKVVAVDIDGVDLEEDNVLIVKANILDVIDTLKFNKIISNIPYNISEPLFKKLFKRDFELCILTVGERFAKILTGRDNRIGIIANQLYDINILRDVPKEAFNPRPKVRSKVLKIRPKEDIHDNIYRKLVLLDEKKLGNALEKIYGKKIVREIRSMKLLDKKLYGLSNQEFIELNTILKTLPTAQ